MYADRDAGSHHQRAIEPLAKEARASIHEVTQLYETTWAALQVDARITGFLAILTARNVRKILRQRRDWPATGLSGRNTIDQRLI